MNPKVMLRAIVLTPFIATSLTFAQTISVVSVTPAHGSTNVPTSTQIVISFDTSLDLTGFDPLNESTNPVILELQPRLNAFDGSTPVFSNDDKTVTIDVNLEADTHYSLLITGARGVGDAVLNKPVTSKFTTGSSLPTGSISGTITNPGSSPEGTVVG